MAAYRKILVANDLTPAVDLDYGMVGFPGIGSGDTGLVELAEVCSDPAK